jgi:hypothetical protein
MPTTPTARDRRPAGQPLKSPLAAPGEPGSQAAALGTCALPVTQETLSDRAATRAEFEDYLRSGTGPPG